MYSYERTYRTGRAVASILEVVGWVIVVIGVIAALVGLASGGFFGMASRGFGSSETGLILRIAAMLPGVVTAAFGLLFILQCQHAKATIDNAELTRDMLALASGKPLTTQLQEPAPQALASSEPQSYRGFDIIHSNGKYVAYGEEFSSLEDAKQYLENIEAPRLK